MTIPILQQCLNELNQKRVSVSQDDTYILFNYRPEVEFDNLWNNINIWCRGIIFNKHTGELIALPFKKFWNVNQHPTTKFDSLLSKGPPIEVKQKMDGSLGIGPFNKSEEPLRISTRGSLFSEQSQWAQNWFLSNISDNECSKLIKDSQIYTYLWEIIYHENKVVIKYDYEGLVFLAKIRKSDGFISYDDSFVPLSWKRAQSFQDLTLNQLVERSKTLPGTEEGWVLTFSDQTLVKVKGDEYKRLHRIISNFTPRRIYEALSIGMSEEAFLQGIPDELSEEFHSIKSHLLSIYEKFDSSVKQVFISLPQNCNRRDSALICKYNLNQSLWSCFFNLLDNQNELYKTNLWKAVGNNQKLL